MNHYDGPCMKCEHWIDAEQREADKYERLLWEREQWIKDNGFDYE